VPADLFQKDVRTINEHIKNIYADNELEPLSTIRKFRRQQPIDGYIVDFVSFETRLIIELDGGQHAMNRQKDIKRDRCLTRNGFTVLRFWNHQILGNLNGVLETIRKACLK